LKKIIFILLVVFCGHLSRGQSPTWGLHTGILMGGPIPNTIEDNSNAHLKIGSSLGVFKKYNLTEKIYFKPDVSFQFVTLQYGQSSRHDTTVTIEIPMQNGGVLISAIETYYKLNVAGAMKLHFFKVSPFFGYQLGLFSFELAPSMLYFSGGYDKGLVIVTVGEGGVTGIEDYTETFNNTDDINSLSFGLSFNIDAKLYKNIGITLNINRSLTPFYAKESGMGNFYLTDFGLNLSYSF